MSLAGPAEASAVLSLGSQFPTLRGSARAHWSNSGCTRKCQCQTNSAGLHMHHGLVVPALTNRLAEMGPMSNSGFHRPGGWPRALLGAVAKLMKKQRSQNIGIWPIDCEAVPHIDRNRAHQDLVKGSAGFMTSRRMHKNLNRSDTDLLSVLSTKTSRARLQT